MISAAFSSTTAVSLLRSSKGSVPGRHGLPTHAGCQLSCDANRSFWAFEIGVYVLLGVTSSLIALPVFHPDILPAERPEWEQLRVEHLALIRGAFDALRPSQKVILFCHDPSALPFLSREESVRMKLPQIEQTVIGHLHSNLIFWKSKLLAGMPRIGFLGHSAKRMSSALNEARCWRPFKVRLCPSLAGIELLKDGGYLTAQLDLSGAEPARFKVHRLPRTSPPATA